MLWQGRRESSNVEDIRNQSGPSGFGGGRFSLFSLPIGNRARLILLVVIVVAALVSGGDPLRWLNGDFSNAQQTSSPAQFAANDDDKRFAAVVLADTEDVWTTIFKQRGQVYSMPKLVLFRRAVATNCGVASATVGPFYCPRDSRLYIDLDFLSSLQNRLGAQGDFARAYVIAHEVGHHVQNLLGDMNEATLTRGSNGTEVRTELQADCYAGIWTHYTEQMEHSIQPGDIDEAMNAASAVGDDRIQQHEQGYVVPESFSHGTSAQRKYWFTQGYKTGKIEACDTFNAQKL